jgi:hypothetical protein
MTLVQWIAGISLGLAIEAAIFLGIVWARAKIERLYED